ncbi:SWIM zinc finger family protein [Moraxella sp. K1664]|uniref:SWIM-type domain-containing protein n=2 Tax=Moraxella lacunata TaxID=477 RepID=A0A1B8PZ69_MORLA|nr:MULTISPECIES: SWIM zinc finger family protein [Moraxella]MBE9579076.1 SWIM zinc finger family protein [Moraxella sp. K1664]MDH9219005.1 SWIM zinc finger domain-containing protein [Moraxella lacunata]MDI4483118.1 SWIM zinc finger family protein [Moraxella lacunata]MDI4507598.1 SWIM zinc finger family protein [Moraxella lacunata]OBX61136.1 hypothetical protein A9Z63_08760 [Moraxella lacunata]
MSLADIDVSYQSPSRLIKKPTFDELVLSHHTDIEELTDIPCFFWGEITEPLPTAKALMCLSRVVRSSFAPIPVSLRDPIISAGRDELRFEGFSSCNGVYARLDLLSDGMDGEFIAHGTTNVDFNEPMINALNAVKKNELMMMSVGDKEVNISTDVGNIKEKKVKLPDRWIKGLTSVQVYMADMVEIFRLNKMQSMQFFNTIPKSKNNATLYLTYKLNKVVISPIYAKGSIKVGGLERLRLLENLVPYIDNMVFFQNINDDKDSQSMAIQIYMKHMRLTLAISPHNHRGFSGEGNILQKITHELPTEYIYAFNHLLKSNENFDPTTLAIDNDLYIDDVKSLTTHLSMIGLLGFDLYSDSYYYRRLPFNMNKLLSLNPRLNNAKKLIKDDNITLVHHRPNDTLAHVKSGEHTYTVVITDTHAKCTCQWYAKHQTKRGLCKHILGVQMMINAL